MRTKHIEVDWHFIREKTLSSGLINISSVSSNNQFDDIINKSLQEPRIDYICNQLDAYAPGWGGVLNIPYLLVLL
jgi:hypothetical protein